MRKILLVLGIATALVLAGSAIALAGGATIPHGGYSSTTDACLQCHDVHEAAGEYQLTRWATVTDTCGSCHNLYLSAPGTLPGYGPEPTNRSKPGVPYGSYTTLPGGGGLGGLGAYDPGYPGTEANPGQASSFRAYMVPEGTRTSHAGHRLGLGAGNWLFADAETKSGEYIPAGTETLTRVVSWSLVPDVAVESALASNFGPSGTNGLYCADCHTPHGNFGSMLNMGVNANILSGNPNKRILKTGSGSVTTSGNIEVWSPLTPKVVYPTQADAIAKTNGIDITGTQDFNAAEDTTIYRNDVSSWPKEGGNWCAKCHDKRLHWTKDYQGVGPYNNHPDVFCLDCHGNVAGGNADFPHTGEENLLGLASSPDGFCIRCHVAGSLP